MLYTRFIIAFLALSLLNCKPESSENIQASLPIEKSLFNIQYQKSTDTSLDRAERLKGARLAYKEADKGDVDSLKIKALLELTKLLNKEYLTDSAIHYSKELLHIGQQNTDSVIIGKSYYKLGYYNSIKFVLDSSLFYYNESIKIFEILNDSLQIGQNLEKMAVLHSDIGNYTVSDELAIEALKFYKNFDKPVNNATLYNCMAINAKLRQEYEEALYWYQKAIETTTSEKNKLVYLNNVANIYKKTGDYEVAIKRYESILDNEKIISDPINYSRTLDNLAYSRWLLTKDPVHIKECLKALKIRIQIDDIKGQIMSNINLSEIYFDNDIAKSREHAHNVYQLATQINHAEDRLEGLALLMRSSNTPNSYNNYAKEYIFLADSVKRAHEKLENKFAKIYFDSEENRDENVALKTANLEKELKLSQSQQMNTIYLSLGIISIISFVLIFMLFRSRYQKEKLEEVYLTETRISKKVHDEVANDLYKTMVDLERDDSNKEILLDNLEQVYEKTRDISREFNALDLETDFSEVVKDLLYSYKNEDVNIITKGMSQVNLNNIDIPKKTVIYRVLQELMTNMKKHSQASLVILTMKDVKNKLQITYSDDGVGCEINKSNGLLNAENRINSLNGKLTLHSNKNEGFKATIII